MEEVATRKDAQHLGCPFRITDGQVNNLTADIIHAGVRKICNEAFLTLIIHQSIKPP